MESYYKDILSTEYQPYQAAPTDGTQGGARKKKSHKTDEDQDDTTEKLSGNEQINKVLKDKKDTYLGKLSRDNIKNVRFRTPVILTSKSATNPKKFTTQNVFFIRYDRETEGIWYSFIDPWQVSAMTSIFAQMAKSQKALWPAYFRFQEKFVPLSLINYDETYYLKQ